MPKKLPQDKINSVLALLDDQKTYTQIHKRTGVSIPSISNLRAKHRPDHQTAPGGRPRKLNPAATRYAVYLVTNRNSVNTREATKVLSQVAGESVSSRTVRRALRRSGLEPVSKVKKARPSRKCAGARKHWAVCS